MPMTPIGMWHDPAGGGLSVSPVGNGDYNSRFNNNCYAGVQFNSNGIEYEYTNTGAATVSQGNWLDSGNAGDVWVQYTRTGGTLTWWNSLDPGTGRLNLGTTRSYRLVDSVGIGNNTVTITGYFRMFDAASGGNTIWTGPTATYEAWYEYEACPTCCFTPETLVTLGSGVQVPIHTINKGDMILTVNGEMPVGEVITRENRAMYRITFHDGSFIDTSDDHPFEVKGKGATSIAHWDEVYKELAPRAELKVGDRVSTQTMMYRKIVDIHPIVYPGTVYTFSNTLFYANGLLVY